MGTHSTSLSGLSATERVLQRLRNEGSVRDQHLLIVGLSGQTGCGGHIPSGSLITVFIFLFLRRKAIEKINPTAVSRRFG